MTFLKESYFRDAFDRSEIEALLDMAAKLGTSSTASHFYLNARYWFNSSNNPLYFVNMTSSLMQALMDDMTTYENTHGLTSSLIHAKEHISNSVDNLIRHKLQDIMSKLWI